MKTTLRLIFLAKPKGVSGWPNIDFDPIKRSKEIEDRLKKAFPDFNFIGSKIVTNEAQAKDVRKQIKNEDGLIIYIIASYWDNDGGLLNTGLPTLLINDPLFYGGAGLTHLSQLIIKYKSKALILSTSDYKTIFKKIRFFGIIKKLKNSKALIYRDENFVEPFGEIKDPAYAEKIHQQLGIQFKYFPPEHLLKLYDEQNLDEAKVQADKWIAEAEKVVEPSQKDIVASARLYLALKKQADLEGANAVSIDCLNIFSEKLLPAYPCLAWVQFASDGLIGTCEADLDALTTQLILKFVTGQSSFISDPEIDTDRNLLIHAHCVAPFNMHGRKDPYIIRSHAEDDKSASIQVRMKEGRIVTVCRVLANEEKILLHTGRIIGNIDSDRGCRTKVAIKVKDAQSFLDNWIGSWHRVLTYGDWREEIRDLATLLGYKIEIEPSVK